jgi:hypothetical protein
MSHVKISVAPNRYKLHNNTIKCFTLGAWRFRGEKVPHTVTTVNEWRCIREKVPPIVTTLSGDVYVKSATNCYYTK